MPAPSMDLEKLGNVAKRGKRYSIGRDEFYKTILYYIFYKSKFRPPGAKKVFIFSDFVNRQHHFKLFTQVTANIDTMQGTIPTFPVACL